MSGRQCNAGMDYTEQFAANLLALVDAGVVTVNALAEAAGIHRTKMSDFLHRRQQDLRLSVACDRRPSRHALRVTDGSPRENSCTIGLTRVHR